MRSQDQGKKTAGSRRVRGRNARSLRPGVEGLDGRVLMAGGIAVDYAVASRWGSGFQAGMTIRNGGTTGLASWTLGFDSAATITSVWDAQVVSHVGKHYVLQSAGWNAAIAPGGSVAFGYIASASDAEPTNETVNGIPVDGTNPTPPALPTVAIADGAATASPTGPVDLAFVVRLSAASTSAVTLSYATSDGTARAGLDYAATSGTLTIPAGQASATIKVPVTNRPAVGATAAFSLKIASPGGATLGNATATGTITEAAVSPTTGGATATYSVTSDWGIGFNGQVRIANPGSTPLTNWTVSFDFPGTISSVWDGTMVSHVGTRYTVAGTAWNGAIPAGGAASFGFGGNGSSAAVTNLVLKGTGVTNPNPSGPPVANPDAATTPQGRAVTLEVLANDTTPAGSTLALVRFTQGAHGSVALASDGRSLVYTPAAGYVGPDAFTYDEANGSGSATGSVAISVVAPGQGVTWPGQFYAPYVDMTLYPTYNLASAMQAGAARFFTLAFVTADPQSRPSWGGYAEYAVNGGSFDLGVRSQVAAVRAAGGDVMVSFGGASGRELAQAITSVPALTAAYQTVIDAYGATHLDFDIEGAAAADPASIDRRSQALAAIQATAVAAGKPLSIDLTLPVLPSGLTADGVNVVKSALKYGVKLAGVDIMAMDYGDGAAPNPSGQMGAYAIASAASTFDQLRGLYSVATTSDAQVWKMVGITPMIGLNDVTTERFDPADAARVVAFAAQKGVGRISIWSLNRDRQNAAGAISYVDTTSSSVIQSPFAFSKAFRSYEL